MAYDFYTSMFIGIFLFLSVCERFLNKLYKTLHFVANCCSLSVCVLFKCIYIHSPFRGLIFFCPFLVETSSELILTSSELIQTSSELRKDYSISEIFFSFYLSENAK